MIKLSKAIEIVTLITKNRKGVLDYDGVAAATLLIEAGKRIQECRRVDHMIAEDYLPNEEAE